ncbi:DUF6855 family protein [Spirosoma sp.]|uniref:DUF6855 family protein n=1 Tax=Spirosoma sp. TaxID=1899569 RepID=UPI00342F1058
MCYCCRRIWCAHGPTFYIFCTSTSSYTSPARASVCLKTTTSATQNYHNNGTDNRNKNQLIKGPFHGGCSEGDPVEGLYGLKKGFRGRFSMYIPLLLEVLAKVDHNPKNNRLRAV